MTDESSCCEHCEKVTEMAGDVRGVKDSLVRIEAGMVSQVEFRPVKAIVYGFVGLVLTGVALAGINALVGK